MWETERNIVLEASQRMAEKGLVVGTSGNVSLCFESGDGRELVAITPNNRYYNTLNVQDIVIVNLDGERVEGQLTTSIETALHVAIYKARKKIHAVIHTHQIFASVLSVIGKDIPPILDDQVTYLGGEIKVAPYALPGSQELVHNVLTALGPRNATIAANHGAFSVGKDMRDAFTNCEMLEKTAQIFISALGAGKLNTLPATALEMELAYFDYQYGEGH